MPDTGAPWNIPYVTSTDLVSDWPADSLALANAIDAGLDAAANAGIGSNVVQTVKTDAFSTTSTASYADVTGMTVTITPSSATSKVLVVADYSLSGTAGTVFTRLVRDSTDIYVSTVGGVEDTTKSLTIFNLDPRLIGSPTVVFLDSPATASAVTYKLTMKVSTGTGYINRNGSATDPAFVSSITAIEVAA